MFLAALLLNGFLLVGAAVQAAAFAAPSQVAWWLALAFVPNAILWVSAPPPQLVANRARWAIGCALVPGLCMVFGPSPLSDDLYRFAWDARVWFAGYNAYAHAPVAPALSALRDNLYSGINFPFVATIYPPLAQGLFLLGYGLSKALWSIKLVSLLAHLLAVGLLAGAGTRLVEPAAADRAAGRIYSFALNPLAVAETAMSGHIDGYVGLALLLAALAFAERRPARGTVWLGVCSGLKLLGAAAVPWLLRRRPRAAFALMLVTVAVAAPLVTAGGRQSPAGLVAYAHRWHGNEGGFAVLRWLSAPLLTWVADDDREAAMVHDQPVRVGVLEPFLRFLDDRGIPTRFRGGERRAPRPYGVVPRVYAVGLVARSLAVLALLGIALGLGYRSLKPEGLRNLMLWALLLSPQVHPWYLLWVLPLDVALGRPLMTAWCAAVLATYAPVDKWVMMRVWAPNGWAQAAQWLLVFCLVAAESTSLRCALTRFRRRSLL